MNVINKSFLIIGFSLISLVAYADFPGNDMSNLNTGNSLQGIVSKGAIAKAKKIMSYSDNKLDKLEFKFGGASAWLNTKGDWNIKGGVKHNRVLCVTYQLGIRFGKGVNGCINPVWITDYEYGTNMKHCNSAELVHIGGGYFSELENKISEVTCAQVDVKCFGATCNK